MPESYEPGQYEYHYNREERQDTQSRWLKEFNRKQSFYQRHRMIIIIFVDIVFIVVVFLIFSPFAGLGAPRVGDYLLETRGLLFDGEILVRVTARPREGAAQEPVRIHLLVSGSKEFENESVETRGLLSGEDEQIFRINVLPEEELDTVYLKVIIGEDEKILEIPLENL